MAEGIRVADARYLALLDTLTALIEEFTRHADNPCFPVDVRNADRRIADRLTAELAKHRTP